MSPAKKRHNARITIESLPLELLDSCIFWLKSPEDLLPLALTCRALHAIIIPNHIEYRHIRCSFAEGQELWKQLVGRRDLASRIRVMEINLPSTRKQRRLLPLKSSATVLDKNAAAEMVPLLVNFRSAVGNMQSLERLSWIALADWEVEIGLQELRSPYIRELKVQVARSLAIERTQHSTSQITSAGYYRNNSFTHVLLDFGASLVNSFSQVLLSCKSLQELSLSIRNDRETNISLWQLFKGASWPNLRTFEIRGCFLASGEENDNFDGSTATRVSPDGVIQEFLNKHSPHLQCLNICPSSQIRQVSLDPNALPNLHSLACVLDMITAHVDTSLPLVARLRHLCLHYVPDGEEAVTHVLDILQHARCLKSLVLERWGYLDVKVLVQCVTPELEKLEIGVLIGAPYSDDYESTLAPYACLKRLTHLSGILRAPYFQEDRSKYFVLGRLLENFGALEFILLYCFDSPLERYQIIREEGRGSVYKFREGDYVDELDNRRWGGFLCF